MRDLAWGRRESKIRQSSKTTICATRCAWQDYLYWQRQDKKTLKRINRLINDTLKNPFSGIGKPEPLKENLSGYWSRRIDESNRLVYRVDDKYIKVISCRYHY